MKASITAYITGFVVSLLLTMAAYLLVTENLLVGGALTAGLVILALIQLSVQLIFFLHLGQESKPRWNSTAFIFTSMVVLILVFGSLWIMNNLNYSMHFEGGVNQSIINSEAIPR